MKRRSIMSVLLVMVVLFSLVITGCSGSSGDSSNNSASGSQTGQTSGSENKGGSDTSGVTIKFMGEASGVTDAMESLIPDFEQKTGIKVEVEKYPYDTVVQKAMLDFTSGTKIYDVLSIPYEFLGRVVEKGYIQDIEKYLSDKNLTPDDFDVNDIIPAMWKASANWKGKYYGFPSNACIMFLWYRKDLLENEGEKAAFKSKYGYDLAVPKTTREYFDVTQFFTRKAGEKLAGETLKENFYGLATMSKRHTALTCDFLNWMWTFDGGVFDGDGDSGNVTMNSENNLKALEYYKSLLKNAVPGSIEYTWDELTTAMQQGIIFSAVGFNDCIPSILDSTKSKVVGKLAYALTPSEARTAAHYGAWTYTIPTGSNNPEAAYKFMTWALSKETQKNWTLKGGIPGRESVYNDPDISKIEFMPMTLEAMKISDARPRIAEWGEMDTILQEEVHKALTDQVAPKQALDSIQSQFEKILKK